MGWHAQPTAQVILEGECPPTPLLGGKGGHRIRYRDERTQRWPAQHRRMLARRRAGRIRQDARYLADRQAFGGPCSTSLTIRFALADMATALETSRLMLWRAASALDNDDPDKVALCAMAKRYVTDSCFDVADQALQLHGGYGYLAEYGLEKIVRDLRVHRILEGTNEIMRVVIGRSEAARVRG